MDFDFQNQLQASNNLPSNNNPNNTQSLSLSNTNINNSMNNNINSNSSNPEDSHYYQQYCRLFLANIALTNQLKQLIQQKNNLKYRLNKYQDQQGLSSYERNEKNKRFRRNAHQIQRFYKCNVKTCGKSYGSQGSLHQHYKLKHPEVYATLPNVQCVNSSTIGSSNTHINNHSNINRDIQSFSHSKEQHNHNENNYSSIFSSNNFLNIQLKDQIKHSNSKINSILKQLGDLCSYKSIKIQEFNLLEMDDNKQNNKENIQNQMNMNIMGNSDKQIKDQKPQKLNFTRKDQFIIQSIDYQNQNTQLKRSSRTIKKREFNF